MSRPPKYEVGDRVRMPYSSNTQYKTITKIGGAPINALPYREEQKAYYYDNSNSWDYCVTLDSYGEDLRDRKSLKRKEFKESMHQLLQEG